MPIRAWARTAVKTLTDLALHVADLAGGELILGGLDTRFLEEFQKGHFLGQEEEQSLPRALGAARSAPNAVNVVLWCPPRALGETTGTWEGACAGWLPWGHLGGRTARSSPPWGYRDPAPQLQTTTDTHRHAANFTLHLLLHCHLVGAASLTVGAQENAMRRVAKLKERGSAFALLLLSLQAQGEAGRGIRAPRLCPTHVNVQHRNVNII